MRKNVFFAFSAFSLFWGGMCWVLFSLKIGIMAGLIAGILGIVYYFIIVTSVPKNKSDRRISEEKLKIKKY